MKQKSPIPCVATLIFNPQGQVLLGRRLGKAWKNHYAPPGGKVDWGERVQDAACRETWEEAALNSYNLLHVGVEEDITENHHFLTFFFQTSHFSNTPANMEPDKCAGWDWYDLDKLPAPLIPSIRRALRRAGRSPL